MRVLVSGDHGLDYGDQISPIELISKGALRLRHTECGGEIALTDQGGIFRLRCRLCGQERVSSNELSQHIRKLMITEEEIANVRGADGGSLELIADFNRPQRAHIARKPAGYEHSMSSIITAVVVLGVVLALFALIVYMFPQVLHYVVRKL